MRARLMRDTDNARTVIETRIAYDTHISDLARRLYIGLCGAGAWSHSLDVRTREWAQRLGVSQEAIRTALRQLADHVYIRRIVRPGARTQRVSMPLEHAAEGRD